MSGPSSDPSTPAPSPDTGTTGDLDTPNLWLFNEGTERYAHRLLGAHTVRSGTRFSVWAPNARQVSVIGDFNDWTTRAAGSVLERVDDSGVWSGLVPGAEPGHRYKFRVVEVDGVESDRADPYARRSENAPANASIIDASGHDWADAAWMERRGTATSTDAPVSIYEVHLGSWGCTTPENGRFPGYERIGAALVEHLTAHGFTHVELMPVMSHPFYGSWGYQTTGYFAPSGLYGSPTELRRMIDLLHGAGIGVILDWVPSHFPTDDFALARFDGTALYEYEDRREGFHPDWNSAIFNYSRNEVRSFLISSAISWLESFHADGLRVDAVASMLYRDYSRAPGEWLPNVHGGRENLEAISLLQDLNTAIAEEFPGVATFAEESTSFPGVTAPVEGGGLGFTYKWDMGWMHDTLAYFREDPVHRKWHQGDLSFRSVYAFDENFTLPLSHDEVVHEKGSLLDQMSGDNWQKFANLRMLYGYQWTQPGKKLLFMGNELAPTGDWSHEEVLDWSLHDVAANAGVRTWVADLNALYRSEPSLHQGDCEPDGFEWIDSSDADNSVFCYLRLASGSGRKPRSAVNPFRSATEIAEEARYSSALVVVMNATPIPRSDYRIGVPSAGAWKVVADSDASRYGGSGWLDAQLGIDPVLDSEPVPYHGRAHSIVTELPPLGLVVLALR